MERKIGETFEFDGKTLQVKAANDDGCEGCIFNVKCKHGIKSVTGLCESGYRDDKRDVIFVEVKERKIGEVFEFRGKKLKVTEHRSDCVGCFFDGQFKSCLKEETGECGEYIRSDHKSVIFVEVKDEQQQEQTEQPQTEQQPQKLNLCEILKGCPEGTELWSDNYGIVKFVNVGTEWDTPIGVELTNGFIAHYTEEGWCDKRFPANCLLWPSRDCRDWSKFTAPWLKKERFDPKTLKPFDRVLCKNGLDMWRCDFFSSYMETCVCQNVCISGSYSYCIPYNDETKHLVGTKEEAPDFYKYWED